MATTVPVHPMRSARRTSVLIAGGGVAGLETLLALRALAGDRLDITILAPERSFLNRSMSVAQPFERQRVRGIRLHDVAADLSAHWHRGAVDRVEHDRRRVVTTDGDVLPYDVLVLAIGARSRREWSADGVLSYHDGRDGPGYRMLLHELRDGRVRRVAFVKPAGASWPLPLYDLALMTAAQCREQRCAGVELALLTPEQEPLGIFGAPASAAVRRVLADAGIALQTASYAVPAARGWLRIAPGARRLHAERIVTEPRLVGPRLRGIPAARDGFIRTDAHGRLPGLDGVFAAGDATAFPVKQGGLAAQQAGAVAEAIAASVGAYVDPQPFRPVLRGLLMTGAGPLYLRADISGRAGESSTLSGATLWQPADKLAGRYLAPYLNAQVGEASDVMPQHEGAALAPAL
jgi:sulfide:quinone oxidoreductase